MDRVTLRKAGAHDREFAWRVRTAAFKPYLERVSGWDEDAERRLHDRRFDTQDFRIVAVAGAEAGIMAVVVAPDCLKVHQLLLLPEHQGRTIGRQCMILVMEEARRLGRPVRLRVLKVNPRALAFYERLGFARTGSTDTHDLLEWA